MSSCDRLWWARLRRSYLSFYVAGLLGAAYVAAAGFSSASAALKGGAAEKLRHYQQIRLLDLEGRQVEPLAGRTARATVFVFTRTDCPISNRYAPELQRIDHEFGSSHVTFWVVYVDPGETMESIRRHLKEYAYPFGALRDPHHAFAHMTGVTVTPEVAVFIPAGGSAIPDRGSKVSNDSESRMVYRGRIDDRYVDFGKERPQPTTHDLERVLKAIVEGKPLKTETTRAVGCFISDLEPR